MAMPVSVPAIPSRRRPVLRPGLTGLFSLCLVLTMTGCRPDSETHDTHSSAPPPSMLGRSAEEIWQTCLLCHGGREMQRGPILNGLPAWYLDRQLRKFQSGLRGNSQENRSAALMAAAISQIQNDTERRRVADHIAALPRPPQWVTVRGNPDKGETIFLICRNCHGSAGEGNPSLGAPPIRLLEDWYMLDQLRKIKAGLRGGSNADPDVLSMRLAMQHLSDEDLRHVTCYVATRLSPPELRQPSSPAAPP